VNFIEVADGIYQRETAALVESEVFRSVVDVVLFAAGDAMGAGMGVQHLRTAGIDVAAVSGRLTRSPLAAREAATAIGLPVLGVHELMDPEVSLDLLGLDRTALDEPHVTAAAAWPEPDGEPTGPDSSAAPDGSAAPGNPPGASPFFLDDIFVPSQDLGDELIPEQR
jgi:hypothetical protein